MPLDRRPIEQMIADVGGAAFQRLARLFEAETRDAVKEMRRLLAAQDWRELGRQAHSLKHATASFGLVDMAEAAYALERAADAVRPDDAAALVARLERMIAGELGELDAALRALDA
ncbi:MAG TPA: Hpt domain-containing protein [Dongiaceae bacterium]|jgi:HPt (histidine-containing phosphotransfer) domain-containing protein|nr:Hpt domain-containing protein [Dongiaceae bacterium]